MTFDYQNIDLHAAAAEALRLEAQGYVRFEGLDYEKQFYEARWPSGLVSMVWPNAGCLHLLDGTGRIAGIRGGLSLTGVYVKPVSEEEFDSQMRDKVNHGIEMASHVAQMVSKVKPPLQKDPSAKRRAAAAAARKARRKNRK